MFKNFAGQKVCVFAFDSATGLPKPADAANITLYVTKDYGSVTALTDTSATELDAVNAKGWYQFDVAQAECNADALLFSGKSSTAGIVVVGACLHTVPVGNMKKNTALANFSFFMTDSTSHNPATGKTVTVTRRLDGGAHAALTDPTVTEVANGEYRCNFSAADRNGDVMTMRATASGCDDLDVTFILTQ